MTSATLVDNNKEIFSKLFTVEISLTDCTDDEIKKLLDELGETVKSINNAAWLGNILNFIQRKEAYA